MSHLQQISPTKASPAPDERTPAPLLRCRGIAKSFGGLKALQDIDFDVAQGSLTALIGPNGAGKTTFFNCITGFQRPDRGEVLLAGRPVTGLSPHEVARLGMVRTFQSVRMFQNLTVFESLAVARASRHSILKRLTDSRRLGPAERDAIMTTLDLLGLVPAADRRCTDLPLLTQRKVEVARALACEPVVLLLDEPTAGATPGERDELADVLRTVRARTGVTIVLIEHNVPFVVSVSEIIHVLDFGRLIAAGTPDEIVNNPTVQEVYLGS